MTKDAMRMKRQHGKTYHVRTDGKGKMHLLIPTRGDRRRGHGDAYCTACDAKGIRYIPYVNRTTEDASLVTCQHCMRTEEYLEYLGQLRFRLDNG